MEEYRRIFLIWKLLSFAWHFSLRRMLFLGMMVKLINKMSVWAQASAVSVSLARARHKLGGRIILLLIKMEYTWEKEFLF